MAGFTNNILNADNVNFSGSNPTVGQVTTNGQLMIGSSVAPNIRVGTLTEGNGISITNGNGSITISTNGSQVANTITGNDAIALHPTAGNWNIVGTGSLTTSGSASTLTASLTGLTNHNVLVGAGTATITKVAPGAAGTVLTSNGAGADPSFQSISATNAFTQVVIQTFTSTGANTYTPTSGMKYCIVEIVGAGGAGGGAATCTASQTSAGGGGGAGAYARGVFSAATVGASQTVTIGTGGTAGSAGNNPGNNGGNSTFGSLLTAGGGSGGGGCPASIAYGASGGAGGTASGTGLAFGQTGAPGFVGCNMFDPVTAFEFFFNSGAGASSFFGTGGRSKTNVDGTGAGAAGSQGGGGSGGVVAPSGTQVAGGAGGNGICIITEFVSV